MKKTLVFILAVHLCLLMNAQGKEKTIPVTTASKKALAYYNEAMKAYQDVNLGKFVEYIGKSLTEDADFFMANYQNAIFAAYTKQEKNFVRNATAAANCKSKISPGEKILKDAVTLLLENRQADLTSFGKKLIEMYPADPEAYLQLSVYQYLIKDFDGEITTLNQVLKLPGRHDFLYNALAYAHMEKGQFREAEEALDKYIELSPMLPNPYDSKGDLYLRTREFNKAYENFKKAYSIDTTWSKGKMLRAKAMVSMERLKGTWQSGNRKDTINIFELHEYFNAFMQVNSSIINGVKRIQLTCTFTYDPERASFINHVLWPNGQTQLWRLRFDSDNMGYFERFEDLKSTTVMYRNTVTFDDPDHLTANNYNGDNARTGTSRWVRTSRPVEKSNDLDQMKLMEQFDGTWEGKTGEGTSQVWEFNRNGKSFYANLYGVNQNIKTRGTMFCYGYNANENRFKGYSLHTSGGYSTWYLTFKTEDTACVEVTRDFSPETAGGKADCIFDDKDTWRLINYNSEGVKVSEMKFVRVKQ